MSSNQELKIMTKATIPLQGRTTRPISPDKAHPKPVDTDALVRQEVLAFLYRVKAGLTNPSPQD
jgi:hypothetical protein